MQFNVIQQKPHEVDIILALHDQLIEMGCIRLDDSFYTKEYLTTKICDRLRCHEYNQDVFIIVSKRLDSIFRTVRSLSDG